MKSLLLSLFMLFAAAQASDGVYASAPPIELEATPTPSLGPPPERRCVLRI